MKGLEMSLNKNQVGYIWVSNNIDLETLCKDLFERIGFYIIETFTSLEKQSTRYKGYCNLFDIINDDDPIPTYKCQFLTKFETDKNSIKVLNITVKREQAYDN